MSKHISVLKLETINALNVKPNGRYVDLTLGRGGHSKEILKRTIDFTPIRSIGMAGLIKSRKQLEGILDIFNHNFKIGMKKILHGKNK